MPKKKGKQNSSGKTVTIKTSAKKKAKKGVVKVKAKLLAKVKTKCLAPAGSQKHKDQRWADHVKDRTNKGKKPMNYATWSKMYDLNMQRARLANKRVSEYHKKLGWGETEVTVKVNDKLGDRRLDIAELDPITKRPKRAVEHKTGYITQSSSILSEVERDKELVKQGCDITWHFEESSTGQYWGGSEPLLKTLKKAGIKVTTQDD